MGGWWRRASGSGGTLQLRIGRLVGVGVGALVAAVGIAAPAQADSVTFAFTGASQSWTVPAGVHRATFTVDGAQGGDIRDEQNAVRGPGGLGARAVATLPVSPAESLQVNVGGQGVDHPADLGSPGGFNGGGATHGCQLSSFWAHGASGGGGSDVRRDADANTSFSLQERLVVSGGGGGGAGAAGGAGGGTTGVAAIGNPLWAGQGATQTAGGAAASTGNSSVYAEAGSLGQGGAGGSYAGACGGGGGGGLWGGGGGTATSQPAPYGGGGGSGFTPDGTGMMTGARAGDGEVTISWDLIPPTVTLVTPAQGANYSILDSPVVDYSCADEGGSGLASCVGTLPDGAPVPHGLLQIGQHTFTVTATDGHGNVTTVTHTYRVSLLGLGIGPL
jgi:hypothetical protein